MPTPPLKPNNRILSPHALIISTNCPVSAVMGVCPNNSRRASVHSDARDAVAGWSVSSGVSFAESRLRRIEVVAVGGEASLARSAGVVGAEEEGVEVEEELRE
jgi:hypothetical protein